MPDINDEMKAAADYAIRSAKENLGQELDFSDLSTDKLKTLLDQVHQSFSKMPRDEKTNNAIYRAANIWGSYLGEFMRKKWGGSWILKGADRLLVINNTEFSPISFIYQKITNHPEYSIDLYLSEAKCKINLPIDKEFQQQEYSQSTGSQIKIKAIDKATKKTKSKNIIYIFVGLGVIAIAAIACFAGYTIINSRGMPLLFLQSTPIPTLTPTVTPTTTPTPTPTPMPLIGLDLSRIVIQPTNYDDFPLIDVRDTPNEFRIIFPMYSNVHDGLLNVYYVGASDSTFNTGISNGIMIYQDDAKASEVYRTIVDSVWSNNQARSFVTYFEIKPLGDEYVGINNYVPGGYYLLDMYLTSIFWRYHEAVLYITVSNTTANDTSLLENLAQIIQSRMIGK